MQIDFANLQYQYQLYKTEIDEVMFAGYRLDIINQRDTLKF